MSPCPEQEWGGHLLCQWKPSMQVLGVRDYKSFSNFLFFFFFLICKIPSLGCAHVQVSVDWLAHAMGSWGRCDGWLRAFFAFFFFLFFFSSLKLHASYLQQPFALQKPHVLACCTHPLRECEHQCDVGLSSSSTKPAETAGVRGVMLEAFAEAGHPWEMQIQWTWGPKQTSGGWVALLWAARSVSLMVSQAEVCAGLLAPGLVPQEGEE